MKKITPDSLDSRLSQLSHDVPPSSDLWPGIHARIGQSARRSRPLLMAACVACRGMSGEQELSVAMFT